MYPDRNKAYDILMEASKLNPGRWVTHSINVAKVTSKFAEALELDEDKAYVYGLLHDIGRRVGVTGARHIIDGYNYLKDLGYEDVARYCLTHSYLIRDIKFLLGKWDFTIEEEEFVKQYLKNVEYDIYDKIVQLADRIALPDGITIIERRLIDIYIRHGVNENTVEDWKATYKIQEEIEEKIGYSIYKLFPEVKESFDSKLIKDILIIK